MSTTRTSVHQSHTTTSPAQPKYPSDTWRTFLVAIAATVGWVTSLAVSRFVEVPANWHQVALFGHLASLVAGLGAVLAIDFHGLQWVLRRRSLQSAVTVGATLSTLVWVGFVGLLATGPLLTPDLSSPLTLAKLGLVLMVGLNGAYAGEVQARLKWAGDHVTGRLIAQAVVTAGISQVGWWGATVLGFVNTQF